MNAPVMLKIDHWLVCSPAVYAGLLSWIAESGDRSLAALRLRNGQIVQVSIEAAASSVMSLLGRGAGIVHVVIERHDREELELTAQLAAISRDVLIYAWRNNPADVVASLNSPERCVSSAWAQHRRMPLEIEIVGQLPGDWRQQYLAALKTWGEAVEREAPWEFAARFKDGRTCRSIGEVLDSLGAALSTRSRNRVDETAIRSVPIVRLLSQQFARATDDPLQLGLGAGVGYAASGSPDTAAPVRGWTLGDGALLTISVAPDDEVAQVVLSLTIALEQAKRLERVEVAVAGELIDLAEGSARVDWSENGHGGSMAIVLVPQSDALAQALKDPHSEAEVSFMASASN
jgi:hypothetical protein